MIKFRRLCAPSCPWGLSFASPTDASRPVCLIPCVWPRSPIFKAPGGLWVSDRSVCILFALHSLPTPQFETQCFTTSITLWKGSLLSFLPLYILPSGMYFFLYLDYLVVLFVIQQLSTAVRSHTIRQNGATPDPGCVGNQVPTPDTVPKLSCTFP